MKIIGNLNEFVEKVDSMKKVNPLDLSSDQDLSIGIMNLISIEEHLFFSGAKTGDKTFYDMILPIREYRKELLQKIIKTYKGEVWCISKHLLASSMRLFEVGTKALAAGKKDEAFSLFDTSYSLYCLFWGLNINNSVSDEEAKEVIKQLDPKTLENIASDGEKHPKAKGAAKAVAAKIATAPAVADGQAETQSITANTASMMQKLKGVVSKALNCCRE